jgi:hypothetical protein
MTKTDSIKIIDNTNEDMNGEAHVLFYNKWQEIRKVQGEEKGQAYEVPEHGNVSIRFNKKYIGKKLRVFVEVD